MKLKRKSIVPPRIEMLPLIDIVFLLLVFFIYAMLSMAVHRGMQFDLPESSQAELTEEEETPISLSIRAGKAGPEIFFNERPIPLLELHQNLTAVHDGQDPPQILIFAEKTLSYQQLYRVLDELQKNGIKNISLQAGSE